ncbi:hypothetical protein ACHHYP_00688 [Achlya hypogyna]|uniref:Secreted protein n=1 Tax=Achlya hypogyna TaxID=1202772 RepID=A0A1V9ZU16_ACHHY|nr:hypothetical protein ACHHYP_00688 [Achlya hypogyna]
MKTMTLLAVAAVAVAQSNPKNYECTPAQLQAAIAPVAAVAVNTVVQCAQDANLSDQNVAAPTQLTSAQVTALLQSTSCAALYAGVQKAIASITPACFVFTQPVPVTSDKITDLSYQAYLEALQGGSLATGAPPPGGATAQPGSSAPPSATTRPGGNGTAAVLTPAVSGTVTSTPAGNGTATSTPGATTATSGSPSAVITSSPATTAAPKPSSNAAAFAPSLVAAAVVAAAFL